MNWKKPISVLLFLALLGLAGGGLPCRAEEKDGGRRIVSMAPNITETVFALGQGNRLVGVTDFCVYPAEAQGLPRVGGFFNPNLERLAALQPDLVLLQGRHEKVDRFCGGRKIPVLHVAMDSLATIYSGIQVLGETLGASERARDLRDEIEKDLEAVRQEAGRRPRRKVFVSLGRAMGSMANLYTVGGSSFLSEVLALAGGENIFADVDLPYPEASKESLIRRGPEVILEMRPGEALSDQRRAQIVSEWRVFEKIPAVQTGTIHVVTDEFVLVPGPRVAMVARILMDAVHRGGND